MEKVLQALYRLEKLLSFNKEVLTLEELSLYTGFSKDYLYKLTCRNEIPFYKPKGKTLFFKKSEIEDWLLSNKSLSDQEIEEQVFSAHIRRPKGRR